MLVDGRHKDNPNMPVTRAHGTPVADGYGTDSQSRVPDSFLPGSMSRIVLAMSGGVDSSVAAWLLREAGHEVIGVFMRHGQEAQIFPGGAWERGCSSGGAGERERVAAAARKHVCCSAADAEDARRVADKLGMPFYVLNFEQEFQRIVDYFVAQYSAGRTPNPCIVCNTWLKFGKLFEYADSVSADYVATGHYARLARLRDGQIALCRGRDESKDQSYVLFGIRREVLGRLQFPLGEHRKEEIRRIAADIGLRVAAKRDSQEICFVPEQDHAGFIRRYPGHVDTSGEIVTTEGKVVGRHSGFEQFTVGQRKGLQVAFGEPRYVIRIEADARQVVIGRHEELARSELYAAEANWLAEEEMLQHPLDCQVKIRYRSRSLPASVEPTGQERFRVCFKEPCYGVAPGQAAVCYDGDRVLGGGWIE
jgi:tRNA-specific 2-thiouridylase